MLKLRLITAFFIIAFLPNSLFGQYDNEPVEYEIPEEINTIGVNITPAAVLLFGAYPATPRFSINYKRQVQPWKKLRVQFNHQVLARYQDDRDLTPLEWSDTTITFRYETRDYYEFDLRFGAEFFKPDRKTSMVYGFDAFVGMAVEYDQERTSPFWYDPELEGNVPSPFVAPEFFDQDIRWGYVGADFSVGQRLDAPNNLNFMILWTPEIRYRWPIAERYSDLEQRINIPNPEVNFRLRGLELLVHYVF